ncbi:MAG TPA: Spy/CpxP family protein refolding chaperone [Blastocatellia bacterium]
MKIEDAPVKRSKNSRRSSRTQSRSRARISALVVTLLSALIVTIFCANAVSSQTLRRRMRIQGRIDRKAQRPAGGQNKLTTSNGGKDKENPEAPGESAAERAPVQPGASNLEGIKQRGLPALFTREELSLWIPGFGNRATILVIFRQLDLTPEQKIKIRALRREVGDKLRSLWQELNLLEAQLDEAIYGSDPASLDSYDPALVKDLTEQIVQKRAEWFRLQIDIESQFRQILTPDQFYVYRELVLQMIRPAGRPLINPAARQRRQQLRMRAQPNPQNKPNPQEQPE